MKITLITVCFNSAVTIRTALESVLDQQGTDYEYLVVDGGSTDGTVDAIKSFEPRFAGRMRWISERDEGMYDAINKGIRMATGEIVGILNADDVLATPKTLAKIAAGFADGVEAVYSDIDFVQGETVAEMRSGRVLRHYSSRPWKPWMHRWGYMPAHPSLYIRKVCFDRLGGYRLGYRISADFELMVRFLSKARIATRYLPFVSVLMRPGGLSTKDWRAKILLNRENCRAERENGYFSCFAMMLPKYLFKVLGLVFKR